MDTSILKNNAKSILKTTYWMSLLACLIISIISSCGTYLSNIVQRMGSGAIDYTEYFEYMSEGDFQAAMEEAEKISSYSNPIIGLLSNAITIAFTIFVLNIVSVGLRKFFLKARFTRKGDIGDMFSTFSNYGSIMKTMFFYDLYIWLWALLFIIPGIIKSYSYYMVPYILAESPNIDTDRAFEISKKTMNGEKANAFIMHLSFLGWYLLGVLACCIGVIFVNPYANATYAEFYAYVKQKSLSTGIATPADYGQA